MLHPIVFEESSKLLIAVTVDEYEHYNQFAYREGTSAEAAWASAMDESQDPVPFIID